MYQESYKLKAENVNLKKILNKRNTLINSFKYEKNDLNEKLNSYES